MTDDTAKDVQGADDAVARAKAGMAIVMDPQSGEILALANNPGFNPNAYSKVPQANRRNRAISDCFEPGSTLKVFAMAEGLQTGLVRSSEQIDCQWGNLEVGGHVIHDSSGHRFVRRMAWSTH